MHQLWRMKFAKSWNLEVHIWVTLSEKTNYKPIGIEVVILLKSQCTWTKHYILPVLYIHIILPMLILTIHFILHIIVLLGFIMERALVFYNSKSVFLNHIKMVSNLGAMIMNWVSTNWLQDTTKSRTLQIWEANDEQKREIYISIIKHELTLLSFLTAGVYGHAGGALSGFL